MDSRDALIQKLRQRIATLEKENRELRTRLAAIEEKLNNLVKPPPKFVKPNVKPRRKKSGGQRGRKGVSRMHGCSVKRSRHHYSRADSMKIRVSFKYDPIEI